MRRRLPHLLALAGVALWSAEARAGKYDLDLTPLGTQTGGAVTPDNQAFRSLSSELGTLIAPKPVDPADSLGISGFAIAADFSINTISSSEAYWDRTTGGRADNVAPSMQLFGRKGLWPGIEVGAGATHVFDSRMWALGGYAKVSLHEGFHHLPIPSIAIRSSFSTLLGSKDLDMTTISPGVAISHVFGVGRTINLTPYIGYEALLILSRSHVLDATPNCDEFPDDYNECPPMPGTSEFVFERGGAIVRHRPHLGLRFIFSVVRITVEAMFTPGGGSSATIDGDNVTDQSGFQQQYTASVGLDF